MEETAEQNEVAATYEEQDQNFASCPREEDEQEDLNPPYDLLGDALGSSPDRTNQELETGDGTAASTADREVEPERLASLRIQADDETKLCDVSNKLLHLDHEWRIAVLRRELRM